jgi:cell volume regulation protein A
MFIAWAGVKGAVPILLAAMAVMQAAPQAERAFRIVVVAVVLAVLVQATPIAWVAARLGVPVHRPPAEPWSLGVGLAHQPTGVQHLTVEVGSEADGALIRDLDLGGRIGVVVRDGRAVTPTGSTRLQRDDQVVLLPGDAGAGREARLFRAP